MKNRQELADLIFPEIHETIADLEARYPARNLPEGAKVTRFAPSPTGFLHTGSLFTAFIGYKIAKDSNGVFYFRLEDTDTKREIKGSDTELLEQLAIFDIVPDEGLTINGKKGDYGPYRQSDRAQIYRTVVKEMIINDLAYPDFTTKEELEEIRRIQEENKELPGYYGKYAVYRDLPVDEAYEKIKAGVPYILRFKSRGDHNKFITIHDEIRGDLSLPENDQDIVILKDDGLPTYHFAHACDDHFMRTNLVTRGEEWISSTPIHVDLFKSLGFKPVKYAHLPVIMKLDENGNKRKLSKRKDNEAAVSYFLKDGYPTEAILTYLMSIANSNFEEFLIANKGQSYHEFKFSLKKMSLDGALFDFEKLKYFSREYLGKLTKDEFTRQALEYARKYNMDIFNLINKDIEYFKNIINIDREKPNPRKDFACFSEIPTVIGYFYKELYENSKFEYDEKLDKATIKSILKDFKELNYSQDEQAWFNSLKEFAPKYNFAVDNKAFKSNPEAFNGNMANFSEIFRVAIAGKKQTPNLFAIINLLGVDEVLRRLDFASSKL